jgi:MtN3 and saliva related transmembrane protein
MTVAELAVAASSWGVLMGIAPVLQIRRMLREQSSRDVSLGYFMILLTGFLLWIAYGVAARNPVLVIPNTVALLVGVALVIVVLRLRHRHGEQAHPRSLLRATFRGRNDAGVSGTPVTLGSTGSPNGRDGSRTIPPRTPSPS